MLLLMRIGIEATCWSNPRGYGRYARGVLTALLADPPLEYTFTLFTDAHTVQNWHLPDRARQIVVDTGASQTEAASASGRRSLGDMWAMAQAVRREPLDILLFPTRFTYFPVWTNAKIILGVHDVIAEKYATLVFPRWQNRLLWQLKGWLGRWQAHRILTVSDYAQQGIVDWFSWPKDRIGVVGEAPAGCFRPISNPNIIHPTLTKHNLTPDTQYLMCLGGLNPHKNLPLFLRVFAEVRQAHPALHLVLVGPAESDTFTPGVANLRQLAEQLGLTEYIHFTDFIPDEEVVHLLNNAYLLVMPSLEEGYGLGAVEAAACGTPVVATQNSPLPQLLAGGGLFVEPTDANALRDAITTLLNNPTRRDEMAQIALQRAQSLTWEKAAEELLELIANC